MCKPFVKPPEKHLEVGLRDSGDQSIRPYIPFKVIYFEKFETEMDAVARERYFRTAAGRRFLKKVLPHRIKFS